MKRRKEMDNKRGSNEITKGEDKRRRERGKHKEAKRERIQQETKGNNGRQKLDKNRRQRGRK